MLKLQITHLPPPKKNNTSKFYKLLLEVFKNFKNSNHQAMGHFRWHRGQPKCSSSSPAMKEIWCERWDLVSWWFGLGCNLWQKKNYRAMYIYIYMWMYINTILYIYKYMTIYVQYLISLVIFIYTYLVRNWTLYNAHICLWVWWVDCTQHRSMYRNLIFHFSHIFSPFMLTFSFTN